MALTFLELYKLHAGNLECEVCGGVACNTNMTCKICGMIDNLIDSSMDDILKDFGSLLTEDVSARYFIESVLKPRAESTASKRLLHILQRISDVMEKKSAG